MTSTMFPPTYTPVAEEPGSSGNSRFFSLSKGLEAGESATFRLCGTWRSGHAAFGFYFFDKDNQVHRSTQFPKNFEDIIGYDFETKKKMRANDDQPVEGGKLDIPKGFTCWAALRVEDGQEPELFILDITQFSIRSFLEENLGFEENQIEDGELAPFLLRITKNEKKGKTSYTSTTRFLKAKPAEKKLWAEVKDSVWIPAIYANNDPFAGRPEGEPLEGPLGQEGAMPEPTNRDEVGADAGWT